MYLSLLHLSLSRPGLAGVALVLLSVCHAAGAADGRAVVAVEFEPAASGELRFEGTPGGQMQVPASGRASLDAAVAPGSHASQLVFVDPALSAYGLVSVRCDDANGASPSQGDRAGRRAAFDVEAGEAVTCTFRFEPQMACTCPREGRWQVVNHPGTMACAGPLLLTIPLTPSRQTGMLTPNAGCSTVLAQGMTDEDADIEMHRQADCSWAGSVGGAQGPIPMQIDFRWTVGDDGRSIRGDLSSEMVQQGTTCRAAREFSLEFEG